MVQEITKVVSLRRISRNHGDVPIHRGGSVVVYVLLPVQGVAYSIPCSSGLLDTSYDLCVGRTLISSSLTDFMVGWLVLGSVHVPVLYSYRRERGRQTR